MASSPNVIRYPIHDLRKNLGGDESSSESSSSGFTEGTNERVGRQSRGQRKQRTRPHTPPSLSTRSLPSTSGKRSTEHTSPFHDATFIMDTEEDTLPPSITFSPPLSPSDLSPPGRLRSRWSSDSSFHDSGDELDPHSRSPLETHLHFVASVSPVSSMDSRVRSNDTGRRQGTLDLTRSSKLPADDLSYDTDSTLSLASCDSESDIDSLSDSEGGSTDRDGLDFQDHNTRESELQDYFTPSSPTSTKEGCASKKMHYTHGHTLQRMPGMVKGFSKVPHYHHYEHSGDLKQVGDGRSRARTLTLGSAAPRSLQLEESDATSAESSDGEFECLGSGFINLNLSETGRDVRVLVRSKQTKARAAGGSLLDYDRILTELLVEEPTLFQDTDDQYHRMLIMYPRDAPQFMIKRLPLSSSELRVILELNQEDVRDVAWNPAPRVICAIDRPRLCLLTDKHIGHESLGRPDDDVFLFFEPLEDVELKAARMGPADYLDMFKELLEGLTFLHQHHAVGFRANMARSFMRLPSPTRRERKPCSGICTPVRHADRDAGQLRYHFVDFAEAHRFHSTAPSCPSTHPSVLQEEWKKDVRDLGSLLEVTLRERLPSEIQGDFMPLATLMVDGRISADAARVMFMDVLRNGEIEKELRKEAKARKLFAQQKPFLKKMSVLARAVPERETFQREKESSVMGGEDDGGEVRVTGARGRSGTITSR